MNHSLFHLQKSGIMRIIILLVFTSFFTLMPISSVHATSINEMGWPFPSGQTWYVYQGYNGYTHKIQSGGWDDTYAFDLVTTTWGDINSAGGASVIAPISGSTTVGNRSASGMGWDVYIRPGDGTLVLLAHMMNVTQNAYNGWVNKGEMIGQVYDQHPGGVNHLHLVVHNASGTAIPLNFGVWHYPSPNPNPVPPGGPTYSSGDWRGTKIMTAAYNDRVSCVINQDGRIDCFLHGSDNHIYQKYWDGATWQGWFDLAGTLASAPTCFPLSSIIHCFAQGTDGHMYQKYWDGATWQGWFDLGNPNGGTPVTPTPVTPTPVTPTPVTPTPVTPPRYSVWLPMIRR